MKTLWFDTETTGLDPKENDIVQIAALYEVDKEIVDKIQLQMQPINWGSVSEEALKVNGYTLDDLRGFMPADAAYCQLVKFLNKYIDRYNKADKLLSAGQNVRFDIDFLRQFFFKNNNQYFGAYFDYHALDLQAMTALLVRNKMLEVENFKLTTVAEAVGVDLGENAHDAMNDIIATREVFIKYEEMLLNGK